MIVVSEIFGPTIQGEGPSAGQTATFIRLGGCNLSCAWCDTPYSWDWSRFEPTEELTHMSVDQIVRNRAISKAPLIVITGGEPLLQARRLPELINRLTGRGRAVEIETNGTRPPIPRGLFRRDDLVFYNISPKLENSEQPLIRRRKPHILRQLARFNGARFKFVVQDEDDLAEIDQLVQTFRIPVNCVWVMPEGRSRAELDDRLGWLTTLAIERQYNVSDRLHVRLWGNVRGR